MAENKVSKVTTSKKEVKFGPLTVGKQLLLRSEADFTGRCAGDGAEEEGKLHTKTSA